MRYQVSWLAALAVPFFLIGCGGGGKSDYDGVWNVSYTSPAASGCTNPFGTITLTQAHGSAQLSQTCTSLPASAPANTLSISVSINGSTSAMNANVNGATLTGSCISVVGCSAQDSTGSKSLGLSR